VNKPLASAYYLKEELKLLWCQVDMQKALEFLATWVKRAYESGLFKLRKFADTFNFSLYRHPKLAQTSNFNWQFGRFNNKIKVHKRKAYG
jgi:transposase